MSIVDRLIASLDARGTVRKIRVGTRWAAAVLDTPHGERAGLATVLHRDHSGPAVSTYDVEPFMSLAPVDLARMLCSSDAREASVGLATINALLDVDESACVEVNAEDIVVSRGTGKRVVIVGHFPFVSTVRQAAAHLTVLEVNPRPGDVPAHRASEFIPEADLVAVTGSTLLNHTFDALAAMWRSDCFVIVLGGSTPLSPVLFDYGVDAVAGARVVDIPAVLDGIERGVSFRELPGKRLLTLFRSQSPVPRPPSK